jgi:hypothetical protein
MIRYQDVIVAVGPRLKSKHGEPVRHDYIEVKHGNLDRNDGSVSRNDD